MKKNWKKAFVFSTATLAASFVSAAFAQYGSGACGPTCEIPTTSAPSCDVPTCDTPTCDVPTCDVPTCDQSYAAPTCDAGASFGCAAGYGCESGYCGNCCLDLCGVVTGAMNVAVSPFKWVVCEFTDGIYPDCGCAPRPEKEDCNPCTICGEYAGGCNDGENGSCGGCSSCNGSNGSGIYYQQDANAYTGSTAAGVYSSSVYDVEQYDASPTRGNVQVPTLPINSGARNNVSSWGKVRNFNFNVPELLGNASNVSNVRSVNYEQKAKSAANVKNVQRQQVVPAQNVQRQVRKVAAPKEVKLQNKQNVRIVSEKTTATRASNAKTFGQTRPVQGL